MVKVWRKSAVWRCDDRLKQGAKSKCKYAPTLKENDLHRAIMMAINKVVENKGDFIGRFRDNVLEVISNYTNKNTSSRYDEQIEKLQKNMVKLIENNAKQGVVDERFDDEYKHLSTQIESLKQEKLSQCQAVTQASDCKNHLNKLDEALIKLNPKVYDFNQELVKRLVESINVGKNMVLEIRFYSRIIVSEKVNSED